MRRVIIIASAFLCLAGAADKKTRVSSEAGNDRVDLYATVLLEPEKIHAALGVDLPAGVIAVQMRVAPRGDSALVVSRDDFTLLSHRDGQRSGALSAAELGNGEAALVVKPVASETSPSGPGWVLGGIAIAREKKTKSTDDPEKSESPENAEKPAAPAKPDPTRQALEAKSLPEGETKDSVSGYLYFNLDGKSKVKDLEIQYKGPGGRLIIPFAWK